MGKHLSLAGCVAMLHGNEIGRMLRIQLRIRDNSPAMDIIGKNGGERLTVDVAIGHCSHGH